MASAEVKFPRCPYCHEQVRRDEEKTACAKCMAWHHQDCWTTACASCGSPNRLVPQLASEPLRAVAPTRRVTPPRVADVGAQSECAACGIGTDGRETWVCPACGAWHHATCMTVVTACGRCNRPFRADRQEPDEDPDQGPDWTARLRRSDPTTAQEPDLPLSERIGRVVVVGLLFVVLPACVLLLLYTLEVRSQAVSKAICTLMLFGACWFALAFVGYTKGY